MLSTNFYFLNLNPTGHLGFLTVSFLSDLPLIQRIVINLLFITLIGLAMSVGVGVAVGIEVAVGVGEGFASLSFIFT